MGKAKQLAIVVRQLQAEAEHFSERMAGARAVAEEARARADVARAALEELRGKYQRDTDKYRRRVGLGRCRRWHGCEIDACEEPPRGCHTNDQTLTNLPRRNTQAITTQGRMQGGAHGGPP